MNQSAEQNRLLSNLIRIGTIAEVNGYTYRVQIGDLLTDFIPTAAIRAHDDATWHPYAIGEQVLILSISGDFNQAVILFALYSDQYPPPSTNPDEHVAKFQDGTTIIYNSKEKTLNADCVGSASITAKNSITATVGSTSILLEPEASTIKSPRITLDGLVTITKALTAQSTIEATGEITGKGIPLSSHAHSGVLPGSSQTGAPSP